MKNDAGDKLHPTQKPEALLQRVILSSTKPGDVVLDPFFGTGTTGAVAKKLGRQWIGIEREKEYIQYAQKRIDAAEVCAEDTVTLANKREEMRIPFGWLIEHGYLKPGEELTDVKGRKVARVHADGNVIIGNHRGSIHKVGALVQNAPSCNGWTYWHVKRNGRIVPIDTMRQDLRSRIASGPSATLQ